MGRERARPGLHLPLHHSHPLSGEIPSFRLYFASNAPCTLFLDFGGESEHCPLGFGAGVSRNSFVQKVIRFSSFRNISNSFFLYSSPRSESKRRKERFYSGLPTRSRLKKRCCSPGEEARSPWGMGAPVCLKVESAHVTVCSLFCRTNVTKSFVFSCSFNPSKGGS